MSVSLFFFFFKSLGDTNLRDHFQKHSGGDLSACYVHGTGRVVVFVIWKIRKFSMKKRTPETRQPGHKQAFETQPVLAFLKGAMSKCGLLRTMS